MSVVRCLAGDRGSIPLLGPAESPIEVGGRLYVIQTWTEAQWARLPLDDRPADAWRHGTVWMRMGAS